MKNAAFSVWSRSSHLTVAVVGLGKVGLPLAVQFAMSGCRVIGCDIHPGVVEMINVGQSHVQEEPGMREGVAEAVAKGLLSATVDTTEAVRKANVVVVIVPVLIDEEHVVDFKAIDAASASIGSGLQPGTLVIYETTVPVGTTSRRFRQILEGISKLRAGDDFFLVYSPERVFSGRILRDLHTYPKIVGGIDEQSAAAGATFYASVLDVPIVSMPSTDEAEFVKIIECVYRDVNIALANEFACYADAQGLDITRAIAAANSQPTSHIHAPGIGVGGHCIPVYPYFLLQGVEGTDHIVHSFGPQTLTLTRYARYINDAMAEYAVQRLESLIGSLDQQAVLILGVAYRGGVRETAFTSAKLLQDALLKRSARVYVHDSLFSKEELCAAGYTPLAPELENDIRAIILQADHDEYRSFDFGRFERCQIVLDGRQALERAEIESRNMYYVSLGDGNYAKPQRSMESGAQSTFSVYR